MIRQLAKKLPEPIQAFLKKTEKRVTNTRRRRKIAMGYYNKKLAMIRKWILQDTETSNFYYGLTAINKDHLAQLIASITGERYEKITAYFAELEGDEALRAHLTAALATTRYGTDISIDYGRRLGWYAFVRVLKPKVVVETGVDHGVGSCVLASALLRNAAEGSPGRYYETEIRPEAGQLFCGSYASTGKILYDDSITSLEQLGEEIDIFVNDSDHSGEYEYSEYLTIAKKLSARAVVLGDNAHVTDSLSKFSRESGRKFVFFAEKPADHWYPGAGIGVSYI